MITNQIAFIGNNHQKNNLCISNLLKPATESRSIEGTTNIKLNDEFEFQLIQRVQLGEAINDLESNSASLLGVVLLIDTNQPNYLSYLIDALSAFKIHLEKSALAIGIISEASSYGQLDFINKRIRDFGFKGPVFDISAESRADVVTLLEALLVSLDYKITA